MSWPTILGIALGLAMDALAVAIAVGVMLPQVTFRHVFRLSFHFGLFQFLMPVVGFLAGQALEKQIARFDHWIAFGLLAALGGKMLWEAQRGEEMERTRDDPTRGWMLLTLSVATSIDALAVGLSLAFLKVPVWSPGVVIGLVAAGLTLVGIRFGSRIGQRFGRWAEAGGGAVLLVIGVRILIGHMT